MKSCYKNLHFYVIAKFVPKFVAGKISKRDVMNRRKEFTKWLISEVSLWLLFWFCELN